MSCFSCVILCLHFLPRCKLTIIVWSLSRCSLAHAGWFCCAKGINKHVKLHVRKGDDSPWEEIHVPSTVKALIVVNLQSYGGGRNLWGWGLSEKDQQRRKLKHPTFNDGLFEVMCYMVINAHFQRKMGTGPNFCVLYGEF